MQNKKIGIIGAMDVELDTLTASLENRETENHYGLLFYTGKLNGREVVIVKCGVGKVNAARCTQILIDTFDPACVINTGVAGGIAKELSVGDIVVADSLLQHDFDLSPLGYVKGCLAMGSAGKEPTVFMPDEGVRTAMEKAAISVIGREHVHLGRVVSGDQFISGAAKKTELREAFSASAAEMEGGAMAQVAANAGVPFAVIRAISDLADGSAPISYETFEKKAAEASAKTLIAALALLPV